jgi:hypothetical protein
MNDAVLHRLAGDLSYQRDLDYFSRGHVERLEDQSGNVRALVHGDQDYSLTRTAHKVVL